MKLTMVMDKFVKGLGQGRVNYEIAHYALMHGVNTTLVASEVAPELDRYSNATWVKIMRPVKPPEIIRNHVFAYRTAKWLEQNRNNTGVLHVNGSGTWAPADVNAAHFVHNAWRKSPVHTGNLRKDLYGAYQRLYTLCNIYLERDAYRKARVIVAVSKRVRGELVESGVPDERIRVIHNGVDLKEFRPGRVDRSSLGVPRDVPLALFAGDIRTPRKNLDTVLKALAKTRLVHLAVVGTTEGSPYPAMSQELGLQDRVHFLGFRRDIAGVMRAADLFVFPSRYEACSLVLLEALASGLPVITAVTAGGAELVTPDCGVVLDDPNDVDALANSIETIAGDAHLRKQMGGNARAVAECHSWAEMAQRYLNLYSEVTRL